MIGLLEDLAPPPLPIAQLTRLDVPGSHHLRLFRFNFTPFGLGPQRARHETFECHGCVVFLHPLPQVFPRYRSLAPIVIFPPGTLCLFQSSAGFMRPVFTKIVSVVPNQPSNSGRDRTAGCACQFPLPLRLFKTRVFRPRGFFFFLFFFVCVLSESPTFPMSVSARH